jgi:hypothetical protein
MHVIKSNSINRRNLFVYRYHAALSAPMGGQLENTFLFYTTDNFLDFLRSAVVNNIGVKYLRVYFAATSNKLDFVYATNDPDHPGQELYYWLDTGSFTSLTYNQALALVRVYRNDKLPIINRQFPLGKGNTICLKHSREHIVEFVGEIDCQHVTGIKAYIASFLDTETGIPDSLFSRLHIEFVLTQKDAGGIEQDFYIDDCGDFGGRRPKIPPSAKEFNNATLCPPCPDCDLNITLDPISCP